MGAKMGGRTTAQEALQGADLTGKQAIVTGGNSGIGTETVRALASAGADVVLCSRSVEAGEAAAEGIRAGGVKGKVTVKSLDLADLESVQAFATAAAAELPRLDILVLNAGVMACPLSRTKQGFETQIGVNHIGHFALTKALQPKLKASGTPSSPSRVVAVSSMAHKMGTIDLEDLNWEQRKYKSWGAYGQSKLANLLFAKELARRLEAEGAPVVAVALHPGVIQTPLQRHMGWLKAPFNALGGLWMKSIPQGAATTVYAAAVEPPPPGGSYLLDCGVGPTSKEGQDMDKAGKLWELTESLIKAKMPGM